MKFSDFQSDYINNGCLIILNDNILLDSEK